VAEQLTIVARQAAMFVLAFDARPGILGNDPVTIGT